MLLGCLIPDLPFGYFQILRWLVCGTCSYRAFLSHESQDRLWMWIFIIAAILFNPLVPVHIDRSMWLVVDITLAIMLITSLPQLRRISAGSKMKE